MKKIVVMLALLAFIIGSASAADVSASVEIGTNIININTENVGNSDYFTSPNYDDVGIELAVETDMFGAIIGIGADEKQGISMYDSYAWIKLGTFARIAIGDFSSRNANFVTSIVDEYDLGILRYGAPGSEYPGFSSDNTIEGDKLNNFVVDFYLGPVTFQFGMNPYVIKPDNTGGRINLGGRLAADIGTFAEVTVTTAYDNKYGGTPGEERTTIGGFVGFPDLLPDLDLMAGYTMSLRMKNNKIDNGIDLRVEMFFGDIAVGIHNNLSLYGDKELVTYNEVKVGTILTDDMDVSLAIRNHYYSSNGAIKDATYDVGIFLGFDYAVTDFAMISTGIDVTGIANDKADVMFGIPLTLKVWF